MIADQAAAAELAALHDKVDAILRLVTALAGGTLGSGGGGASETALLCAVNALLGADEFTAATLLADAGDEANGDEGRAVVRALGALGVATDGERATTHVGVCLRDIHRGGAVHGGRRLVQAAARNRRGVTVWRVVRDVSPATSGTPPGLSDQTSASPNGANGG